MAYAYGHLTSPQNTTSGVSEFALIAPASWFAPGGIKSPGTSSGVGDEVMITDTHEFLDGYGWIKFQLAPEKNSYSADSLGDKGFSKLAHSLKIMLPGSYALEHEVMKNLLQEPGLIVLVKDATCGANWFYQLGCDCTFAWLTSQFTTGTTKDGNKAYQADITYNSQSVVLYYGDITYGLPASTSLSDSARTSTSATMAWKAIAGATGYILERSATADFASPTTIYTGPLLTYADTGLTSATTYYYRVRGTASGFASSAWTTFSVTTQTVLLAPVGNGYSALTDTGFNVHFVNNDSVATGYTVQVSTNSGFTGSPASFTGTLTGIGAKSVSVTGLTTGTQYYVRVKVSGAGYTDSAWASNGSETTL